MKTLKGLLLLTLSIMLTNCNNEEEVLLATSIRVTDISVSNIPQTDNLGNDWDGEFEGVAEWEGILFIDDADLLCDAIGEGDNDTHLARQGTGSEYGISAFTLSMNQTVSIEDIQFPRLGIKIFEDDLSPRQALFCQILEKDFYIGQEVIFTLNFSESNGVNVSVEFEKVF